MQSLPLEVGYRLYRAEKARRSLKEFVRQAWPIIEPSELLVWSWSIDAICEHLEAVRVGRIENLCINVPPGSMKSLLTSVFWIAWIWTTDPWFRGIFASYDERLVLRDSTKTRSIIESTWYQDAFVKGQWALSDDQNAKSFFTNTAGGFRFATTVGGAGTGHRGHAVVTDDPIKADDARSEEKLEGAVRWNDETMSDRFVDIRHPKRILIMQRLHQDDLSGHVLRQGGYEHLIIPAEFETERTCEPTCAACARGETSIGWKDPRTKEGQLFFPARFPLQALNDQRRIKGAAGYAGQYQQRPAPAKGGIFDRDWIKETSMATIAEMQFDEMAISCDAAFKKKPTSDRVAVGVFGRLGPRIYICDVNVGIMGFSDSKQAIRTMKKAWPKVGAIYIEDAANGPAIIEELTREMPGVIGVPTAGGKEARGHATAPYFEAGNIYIPTDAPWANALIQEIADFPFGSYDDQVDMVTHAVVRMMDHTKTTAELFDELEDDFDVDEGYDGIDRDPEPDLGY